MALRLLLAPSAQVAKLVIVALVGDQSREDFLKQIFSSALILAVLLAGGIGQARAEDGPCQDKELPLKVACLNARLAKLEASLASVQTIANGALKADAQFQIFIPFRGQCLQWIDTNRAPNSTGCLPKADERSADQFWTLHLK